MVLFFSAVLPVSIKEKDLEFIGFPHLVHYLSTELFSVILGMMSNYNFNLLVYDA